MRSLHANWFYVAVISTGLAGLWGVVLAIMKRPATRLFRIAGAVAAGAMLVQVSLGLLLYSKGYRPRDDFHMFYGFVILFTFAFGYIYRSTMAKRPALYWGLYLLFVMGLGLRAWANT